MATQLFFRDVEDAVSITHLGTDNANLRGTNVGWTTHGLSLSRGTSIATSGGTATVTGATPGVEIGSTPWEFISPPITDDVTIAGTITANIWGSENSMSANVAINVVIEVIRANTLTTRNSNTLVEIARSTFTTELALTTRAVNNFTVTPTSTVVNRGDRLRIRIFGDDVGTMATGFTFDASWSSPTASSDGDSYVTFTEDFSFAGAPSTANLGSSASSQMIAGSGGINEEQAQSFPAPATGTLSQIKIMLSKGGSPTDNFIIELQSDSSGVPSGTVLGTIATVAASSYILTGTIYTYAFSISVTSGTTYWIVMRRDGARDTTNRISVLTNTAYASGTIATKNSGTWGTVAADAIFSATVTPTPGSTLYLTDTASDVATASVDREAWTSRGSGVVNDVTNTAAGWTAPIQVTDTAGGTVVDWFTKQLQAFTLTGMAVANIRALESNIAANVSLRCQIARVNSDGTSPTVWADWNYSTSGGLIELTTSEVARTCNVSGDDLAFTNGQRIRIRLYIDDINAAAMGASQTVTTYYAGTSAAASGDTYITLPQTVTEYVPGSGGRAIPRRRADRFLTRR